MAENAKDSDERDLRGGRGCAPVRLIDQERRAELDRQGHGRSSAGIQFHGTTGLRDPRSREPEPAKNVTAETSMLSNGLRGSANSRAAPGAGNGVRKRGRPERGGFSF